jgi:beta-xylosidase
VRTKGASLLGIVALVSGGLCTLASAATSGPSLLRPSKPAFAADAPDPDVLPVGSRYFAYTTGTTWGNNLGVLVSNDPLSGWRTVTGHDYGSTALPHPPSWEVAGSQTSPAVAFISGRYVMYYDATLRSDPSLYCLSVATSSGPAGPFSDHSSGPFGPCEKSYDGSVDPDVVTLPGGSRELVWKENESGPYRSAQILEQPLSTSGLSLTGNKHVLLTQDSAKYPWETTTENPDLVYESAHWWLFFSAGKWSNSSYSEAAVTCSGPAGPCSSTPLRLLASYGTVHGPGGASLFESGDGAWYLDFAAWTGACTGAEPGCQRELYVAPLEFSSLSIATSELPTGSLGESYRAQISSTGGYGPRTWSASGLPAGLSLDRSDGVITGTPTSSGTTKVTFTVTTTTGATVHASRSIDLRVS